MRGPPDFSWSPWGACAYAGALLLRGEAAEAGAPPKRELRFAFIEAAREELGMASEPLRRDPPARELDQ
ncbi:hypothetical protein GCM10023085_10180 [Actinomadura viridis]